MENYTLIKILFGVIIIIVLLNLLFPISKTKVDCFDKYGNKILGQECKKMNI